MTMPEFDTIEGQAPSLRDQVHKVMSAAVVSGELEPGTLLTVPTLAERFHVSATPVREALLELQRRGFVSPVRNKGFRVSEVSDEQLRKIAEVRMMLEPPAMETLASHFDRSYEPGLRVLADRMLTGAEEGDLTTYLSVDSEFHQRLTVMVGNPVLTDVIMDLRSRARLNNLTRMAEDGALTNTAAEHHYILDALAAHDPLAAHEIMVTHIRHVSGIWAGNPEENEEN